MIVLLWLAFCIAVGAYANKKGRSFLFFALLSVVISPIGGLIALLVIGEKKPEITGSSSTSAPDYQQQPTSFTSTVSDSDKAVSFCPNCGTMLTPGAKFCPKCGNQINA